MFTPSTSSPCSYMTGRIIAVLVALLMLLAFSGCATMGPQQPVQDDRIEAINKKLDTIYHRLSVIQFMLDDHERILRGMKEAATGTAVVTTGEETETAAVADMPQVAETRAATPSPVSPETIYHAAIEKFRNQQYDDALDQFQQFAETYPDHDLADNALYWAGECLYSQKNFEDAIPIFKKLIRQYPEGNKKPDALLKTGYAYISLGDNVNAEMYLKNVIRNYPFSDAAEKAKDKLGTME